MQYYELYWLSENNSYDDALRATPKRGIIKDEFALLGGTEKPANPIRFDQHDESGGDMFCDVVWTTLVQPVLISHRVVDSFRQGRFTGWTTYPVDFYDKKGARIPDYHGLAITGRCGAIDRSRSRKVLRPIVPGSSPVDFWQGLFFKDDQWDGSDMFLPDGTGYIIVTERVKNALESLNIPDIEFDRLDTLETYI